MLNVSDVEVRRLVSNGRWAFAVNRIARSRVSVICDGVGWQIGSR
jgi:hypothetical protein